MTPVSVALDADSGGDVVPIELLEGAWAHGHLELSATADWGVLSIGSAADVVTAREQGRALAWRPHGGRPGPVGGQPLHVGYETVPGDISGQISNLGQSPRY